MITNHEKDTKILFYKIQNKTSSLLSKLLHQYTVQKELLLKKHSIVSEYLKEQKNIPSDVNLLTIFKKINSDNNQNLYNIYLTDEHLVIRNSTFKKDIGFDLSFAKKSFDEHFEQNITGVCTPLFEKSSKEFFSYTDSYISQADNPKSSVLQISYTYKEPKKRLLEIQKIISKHPIIIDVKAYIIVNTGFVNEIILKKFPSYKPDLKEILSRVKEGLNINAKLFNINLNVKSFEKENTHYTEIYMATQSAISKNTKIIYSILLDDTLLHSKLNNLNSFMFFVTILGVIAILATFKIRKKEIKLTQQDKFVQSSMHEIKTPLSIITLNNELRELELGSDEYSQEINNALKVLKTSYEDMSFTITKDGINYQTESLKLSDMLNERVLYFETIALSKSKSISLTSSSECLVEMSRVELIRLIDNNLSNAIKYSESNSTIKVILDNSRLSFHNKGKPIIDTKHIFDKYFRENRVVGGHGLGLSIVQEIAKKYSIIIKLDSSTQIGTTFSYKFKCHTNDI